MTPPAARAVPSGRRREEITLVVALLAAALALGGCSGEEETAETSPRGTANAVPERVDRLGEVPEGWERFVDRGAGLALALPPGWRANDRGGGVVIRSFDRLAAISLGAGRAAATLRIPAAEFAERALAALPGYRRPLEPSAPRPLAHRYEAVSVRARGRSRDGVPQRVEVIVIRRREIAQVTAALAVRRGAGRTRDLAMRVVRSIRTRPPAAESRKRGAPRPQRPSDRDRAQASGRSG